MLLNGKSEELARYSKLKYNAEKFVQKVREVWEYSELQIRCVYLISDLAKKGNGVFSVAYSTFQKMFEQRFNMKISASSVRRFFALMEKLGLLSKNEAKRKNQSQSANIYIVEQQHEVGQNEHPDEHPDEHLNIVSKETNNNKQKPLTNIVVKQDVDHSEIIHEEYINAKKQGINKTLFKKILDQVESKIGIRNFKAYLHGTIQNVLDHIKNKKNISSISSINDFYNYLETEDNRNTYRFRNKFITYDWLNN